MIPKTLPALFIINISDATFEFQKGKTGFSLLHSLSNHPGEKAISSGNLRDYRGKTTTKKPISSQSSS